MTPENIVDGMGWLFLQMGMLKVILALQWQFCEEQAMSLVLLALFRYDTVHYSYKQIMLCGIVTVQCFAIMQGTWTITSCKHLHVSLSY